MGSVGPAPADVQKSHATRSGVATGPPFVFGSQFGGRASSHHSYKLRPAPVAIGIRSHGYSHFFNYSARSPGSFGCGIQVSDYRSAYRTMLLLQAPQPQVADYQLAQLEAPAAEAEDVDSSRSDL
jgi:hypothetical protein